MAFPRTPPEIRRVGVLSATAIQAIGTAGEVLWTRELGGTVRLNDWVGDLALGDEIHSTDDLLVLRGPGNRPRAVIAATRKPEGVGHLWSIRPDNSRAVRRGLRWMRPAHERLGQLQAIWQMPTPWPGRSDPALAVHVRDGNYSESTLQFFTADLESLGAYYHPGHLAFRSAGDIDGDGRPEILLHGVNNPAALDSTLYPDRPQTYVDCLVLLEPPRVNGQAWPGTAWPGMPRADEEGYLLFPPLTKTTRPTIRRIIFAPAERPDGARMEVVLDDGRIYRLDGRLRPISCSTGDNTPARSLGLDHPIAPLAYWSRGQRELLEIPIR
jgi:hypothetical protein